LRTFLHVVERAKPPADVEHPFQGWLPYLKLVWQPSVQLLEVFSSLASFANTESGAGAGVGVVGDVRPTVFATRLGLCGLATCFGAWTVMLGSVEPVAVCDTAVPLRPHSNAVDKMATAEGATKIDDHLMTMSFPNPGRNAVPMRARYHVFRIELPRVENISANDFRHGGRENADRSLKALRSLPLAR
jgi:hypothetical protein